MMIKFLPALLAVVSQAQVAENQCLDEAKEIIMAQTQKETLICAEIQAYDKPTIANKLSQRSKECQLDASHRHTSTAGMVEIELTNNGNQSYVGEIQIGNPPQKLRVIFDTGSANGWCTSTLARNKTDIKGNHLLFNPSSSQTFQTNDYSCSIQFGSGKLEGTFGRDKFTLGTGGEVLHVQDNEFGLIEKADCFDSNFDCIIGLAYPKMAAHGITPMFDQIIQQNLLSDNLFAFYLASDRSSLQKSTLTFGWLDQTKFQGSIQWHPVIDQLFWSLNLDDVLLDGQSLNLCGPAGSRTQCLITADSGTSALTFPSWAYHMTRNNFVSPHTPCYKEQDFGTLTFKINGINYDIPSSSHVDYSVNKAQDDDQYNCTSRVQLLDIMQEGQQNLFIVGDIFMQIFYTVFDRDQDRVGFAMAK